MNNKSTRITSIEKTNVKNKLLGNIIKNKFSGNLEKINFLERGNLLVKAKVSLPV